MWNLFGLRRADWYTKRPSPVPMSMITPSPVWSNDFVEGSFIELSDCAATNSLDHNQTFQILATDYTDQSKDLIQPPST